MKNRWKKLAALAVSCVMASTMAIGFTACGDDKPNPGPGVGPGPEVTDYVPKQGTYRTYSTALPANWNELSYEDSTDSDMIAFLTSSFIGWDYKFDEAKGGKFKADGSVNADAIVEDAVETKYSAVTKLEDVTATVDVKWGYTPEQKKEGGYAYKFTLRDDLKWDDGTPIDASDFVYTMKEQLSPDFKHYRYSNYLTQIPIMNAAKYVNQKDEGTYETIGSQGYKSNQAAVDADADIYINIVSFFKDLGADVSGLVDKDGHALPKWVPYKDEVEYDAPEVWEAYAEYDTAAKKAEYLASEDVGLVYREGLVDEDGETYNTWATGTDPEAEDYDEYGDTEEAFAAVVGYDPVTGKDVWADYVGPGAQFAGYCEVGANYAGWLGIYVLNTDTDVSFDRVGLYAESKYELVMCLSEPLADYPLNADGSLNFWAGYYLSGLPLVKKDLYESCKQEPASGSTLWTSNYNTSLATTASWGAYKLTAYQSGKSYTLEKNEYWYGWNMDDYKNQYNITKYTCEKVEQVSTAWLGFLNGTYDDVGIDVDHAEDYRNSKYTLFTVNAAQYGASLYANLDVLKESGRNNGILSITEFRKAFSIAIDRADYNATCYTAHRPLLGLLNEAYYHDVENNGVYRSSEQAKKALLRAYGYTENEDGTWDGALIPGLDLEDAYESMSGYNLTYAKKLLEEAYAKVVADPAAYGYDSNKKIELKYGTSTDNANTRRQFGYFQKVVKNLTDGTSLEGKVEVIFDASFTSDGIYDSFKAGEYELAAGLGWGNAPFNPFYMIGCYIEPDTSYSGYWDTYSEMMTFTMPGEEGEYDGAGKEYTMSLMNWYNCLCNYKDDKNVYTYNWSGINTEYRLELLAALEEYLLCQYYFIPTTSYNSAAMLGAKFSYITNDYNTFMSRGGMRYMVVNYTDSEWSAYVSANNNDLSTEYKKTN